MAKIDPKTAKRMYSATNQASKDKIAKERYGEFGFDTLKYEEQQQVYKDNTGLQVSEKDKFKDFEVPKNNKKELPKKVDTRYADNLKIVLEKHRRQNNQPIQEDSKILEGRFKKMSQYKLPHQGPLQFKGANSSNSKCWPGYKKVGTKPSPSGTGETVNDCKKK